MDNTFGPFFDLSLFRLGRGVNVAENTVSVAEHCNFATGLAGGFSFFEFVCIYLKLLLILKMNYSVHFKIIILLFISVKIKIFEEK